VSMPRTTCRSCSAPIVWAVTAKGKRMPLDAVPHPEGNVRLRAGWGSPPLADVLNKGEAVYARCAGEQLHVAHHSTCRHGRAWRRP
jgi:hypothetical protein